MDSKLLCPECKAWQDREHDGLPYLYYSELSEERPRGLI